MACNNFNFITKYEKMGHWVYIYIYIDLCGYFGSCADFYLFIFLSLWINFMCLCFCHYASVFGEFSTLFFPDFYLFVTIFIPFC